MELPGNLCGSGGLCKGRGFDGKVGKREEREKTDEKHRKTRAWGLGGSRDHRDHLHLFNWHRLVVWLQITFRCFIL